MRANRNIYTVKQLNTYVKNMFAQDHFLQSVFVRGEVSNCKYNPRGHIYFTLKDIDCEISCVMFRSWRESGLEFQLQNGQQIVVGGYVALYEEGGKYQLYTRQIVLDGVGLLHERYEQLKAELEESGMFAEQYKQPIPKYIKTLGVVTASTGAAIQDIIQIAGRRNPYVQIILYPATVQGEAAAPSIIAGIRALEKQKVDVMIVGRGGGSIEDLWAFNEREVAQAVFDCSVPIISAVGHETDTTIIDYVSDLRAPTPSAAAELAVTDIRDIFETFDSFEMRLNRPMRQHIEKQRRETERLGMKLKLYHPVTRIREQSQKSLRMEDRLQACMDRILKQKRHRMDLYIARMKGLSPLEKLQSGFSYIEDETGHNIHSIEDVTVGQDLVIRVQDGNIRAQVKEIQEERR